MSTHGGKSSNRSRASAASSATSSGQPSAREVQASIEQLESALAATVMPTPDGAGYRVEIIGARVPLEFASARALVDFQRENYPVPGQRSVATRRSGSPRASASSGARVTRSPAERLARLRAEIGRREARLETLRNRVYLARGDGTRRGERQRASWERQIAAAERAQARARGREAKLAAKVEGGGGQQGTTAA